MDRRDDTPRDLLFGLLALQNGLIDQDQLVAAFGAWSRARGRTLAEILLERNSIDAESRSLLSAMAEKQLKLHGDDAEKSLAAMAVVADPSTREKLAGLGDASLDSGVALLNSRAPGQDATLTLSVGTATSDGLRFRILRPHAQGGLGAVFVALDGELNREVALKQILDDHADDLSCRARFLIEAEVTGGLEHPGIVPVYGLGHYSDGRPYYAMRFIRGDSLKEAIAAYHSDTSLKSDPGKRSLALRKLLRRFVDVCNAIDYAHGRGVLHRDLKPSNVIVGKHGETLVVDWGLAKPMGHAEVGSQSDERIWIPSSSCGSAETLPGSAVGTPAYMSPEQSVGDLERLGPHSDVYSLGATLYCLLTGRAPFEGADLGAVLLDVQKGSFTPPRQVDPSIDRALEAVCLMAMATRPEDRHTTVRSLADDVERWAADEPVSAWREPASIRARRWMRRNRSAVTAASAAVLMAVVGLAGVLMVESRANATLKAKNAELDESNDRVQARFDLAREAIRSFQAGVNDDDMLKGRELKGLRDKLLRSAAGFYERLEKLLQDQADRHSRAILAQSYFELAELTEKIGIQPEALAMHRKALLIRRELAASADADAGAKLDVARSLIAAGLLAEANGDNAGSLSAYEEALDLAAPLGSGPGATEAAREVLGTSFHRAGRVLSIIGKQAEALASYREALAIRRKLADDAPAVTRFRADLADSLNNIGNLLAQAGHPAEALASLREALAIRWKLADDAPAVTRFRADLSTSHYNIGTQLAGTGQTAEALASYGEALAVQEKLAGDNPAVTRFRDNLADSHNSIGNLLARTGRMVEAFASYRQALAIREELARDNPTVPEYQRGLASSLSRIGKGRILNSDYAGAIAEYRRAIAIMERLPMTTEWLYDLACYRSLLVGVFARHESGMSSDDGEAMALSAISTLRQAIESGFRNLAHMKTDADLDPLRSRPDFQLLMRDLALPPAR